MSFAVVGGSPQSSHGLSPHANVYAVNSTKTPSSSLPRAPVSALPPPFSLSATNGNDLVDMLGSVGGPNAAHSKRVGTDPAKFKTTICRNWEQTGMCSFRGCTFAHGVDDLRPPMRTQNGTLPIPADKGISPTLGPVKVSPNTSPSINASAVHNSGHTVITKLDTLLEQLVVEVNKDKDLSLVHQEASRTLEAMIRREQALRLNSSQQLDQQSQRLEGLLRALAAKDKALSDAIQKAKTKGLDPHIYNSARTLLDETPSVVRAAENCLAEYGINTSTGSTQPNHAPPIAKVQEEHGSPGYNVSEQKNPTTTMPPRSYAAAVTGQRTAPVGLQPIGGSPLESPRDYRTI